ncbi:MAG: esterase [Mycobacterium sp.]|nr:esterase [Mycobacterium sp.]
MTVNPHGLILDTAVQELLDRLDGRDATLTPHDQPAHLAGERWQTIETGQSGPVRLWIVAPTDGGPARGTVVYLRGGGWVGGGLQTHRRLIRDLARRSGATVVAPEYGLGPTAVYPVALHQAYAVTRWVSDTCGTGVAPTRIALAGDSEGAALAIGVALLALRHKTIALRQLVAITPVTDAGFDTASYRLFAHGYGLRRDTMMRRWDQYVPDRQVRTQVTVSPARAAAEDLVGFPPTLVLTAEADVLRDEGETFAATLRSAGAVSTAVRYEGTIHDFVVLDELRNTGAARAATAQAASVLAGALTE